MLYIVALVTWSVSVFASIYISKLLYGKEYCVITNLGIFRMTILFILSPLISIYLFVVFIFKQSCELSDYMLSIRRKACVECINHRYGKCSVYDLNIRKNMLCKGNFFNIQNGTS